mmetsp:Transcript_8507/g.20970  ORF Transcript_8507/g.20970 Transcript_8507/m.20970 type:complete len:238 (-) Transcript_8507:493-1206(-)
MHQTAFALNALRTRITRHHVRRMCPINTVKKACDTKGEMVAGIPLLAVANRHDEVEEKRCDSGQNTVDAPLPPFPASAADQIKSLDGFVPLGLRRLDALLLQVALHHYVLAAILRTQPVFDVEHVAVGLVGDYAPGLDHAAQLVVLAHILEGHVWSFRAVDGVGARLAFGGPYAAVGVIAGEGLAVEAPHHEPLADHRQVGDDVQEAGVVLLEVDRDGEHRAVHDLALHPRYPQRLE